jgi:F0F1-type ATP synthase assembly protein I
VEFPAFVFKGTGITAWHHQWQISFLKKGLFAFFAANFSFVLFVLSFICEEY